MNIPITNDAKHCDDRVPFDHERDCQFGDCVVDAADQEYEFLTQTKIVAVPRVRAAAKEALIYFIHLVGDLHAPMHCSNGGKLNRVTVNGAHVPGNESGDPENDNLFFLWDVSLIEWGELDEAAYVECLFKNHSGSFTFGGSTAAENAHIYAECASVPDKTDLHDDYMDNQRYYADEGLYEAGVARDH